MSGRILVTGAAGFIGFHLALRLLREGKRVTGLDNLNAEYDPSLKRARLEILSKQGGFTFVHESLENSDGMRAAFAQGGFEVVVNLAAQAGVRYSLENPSAYIQSNLVGFANILECCRHFPVKHLVFASSSSVYGANGKLPFSEDDGVDHPVSLYAASKKSNELMAHVYSHLFGIPATGLRFFTVYGPWGRPDMALFKFTRAILAGEPIEVYNHGDMSRDFTYIDDIVEGVARVMDRPATPGPEWDARHPVPHGSYAPYRLYNIGNHKPENLLRMIETLESSLGKKAEKRFMDMQPGDVKATYADIGLIHRDFGFSPSTPIEAGIPKFVAWYRDYYGARP